MDESKAESTGFIVLFIVQVLFRRNKTRWGKRESLCRGNWRARNDGNWGAASNGLVSHTSRNFFFSLESCSVFTIFSQTWELLLLACDDTLLFLENMVTWFNTCLWRIGSSVHVVLYLCQRFCNECEASFQIVPKKPEQTVLHFLCICNELSV